MRLQHAQSLPCYSRSLCCSIIQMLSMIFCRCVNEPITVIFCDKHCLLKAPGTAIRVCLGHEYQCKSPEIRLDTEPDTPGTYQQSYLSYLAHQSERVHHYCISVTSTVYKQELTLQTETASIFASPSCIFSESLGDVSHPSAKLFLLWILLHTLRGSRATALTQKQPKSSPSLTFDDQNGRGGQAFHISVNNTDIFPTVVQLDVTNHQIPWYALKERNKVK